MDEQNNMPDQPQEQPAEEALAVDAPGEDQASRALRNALRLSFLFLQIAMAVLVTVYLASGLFRASPTEVCIKLSFGRPVDYDGRCVLDSESGWHMRWPWQKVIRIPISSRTLVLDSADEYWYREKVELGKDEIVPRNFSALHAAKDGYLLTGDLNIIHSKWVITYEVPIDEEGVKHFAFSYGGALEGAEETSETDIRGAEDVLRYLAMDSIVRCTAGVSVDYALVGGDRDNIIDLVRVDLEKSILDFEEQAGIKLGLSIKHVTHTQLVVPKSVEASFNMVKNMQTENQTLIRKAQGKASEIEIQALGEANAIISSALAEREELVRLAKADAEKMQSLLEEYRKNPAIFTQWHYNSAVEDVLRAAELYLLHEPAEGAAREIRLLVSPVPETLSKFKAAQGQAGARE